jgi:rhamnosyltransferase
MSSKVLVFIPTFNAIDFLERQYLMLKNQTVKCDIFVVDSGSTDGTIELLKRLNITHIVINKNEFNHGLTRNKVMEFKNYDYFLFLTQDAIPYDNFLIANLMKSFNNKEIKIAYGRHIPYPGSNRIEFLSRLFNYPPNMEIVKSINDIENLGIKTFFISNSCCMYDSQFFIEQGGFIKTNVNEDMEFACRTILKGYKIKYVSNAMVYHSHFYSCRDLFYRYKEIGCFFRKFSCNINYSSNKEGLKYVLFILKNLKFNVFLWGRFFCEVFLKYIAFVWGKYISNCDN